MKRIISEVLYWLFYLVGIWTSVMYAGDYIRTPAYIIAVVGPILFIIIGLINKNRIVKFIETKIVEPLKVKSNEKN